MILQDCVGGRLGFRVKGLGFRVGVLEVFGLGLRWGVGVGRLSVESKQLTRRAAPGKASTTNSSRVCQAISYVQGPLTCQTSISAPLAKVVLGDGALPLN